MIHVEVFLDPLEQVIISPWKNEGLLAGRDEGMGFHLAWPRPMEVCVKAGYKNLSACRTAFKTSQLHLLTRS